MTVDNASALQDTLERIRQSYALYFNAPEGVRQGEKRNVQIALNQSATRRYQNAELRYRPTYVVSEGGTTSGPAQVDDTPTVTRRNTGAVGRQEPQQQADDTMVDTPSDNTNRPKRRPAVDEPSSGGWRKVGATTPPEATAKTPTAQTVPAPMKAEDKPASEPEAKSGGFRRLKPGEKP
jgi:hypothetical protein